MWPSRQTIIAGDFNHRQGWLLLLLLLLLRLLRYQWTELAPLYNNRAANGAARYWALLTHISFMLMWVNAVVMVAVMMIAVLNFYF